MSRIIYLIFLFISLKFNYLVALENKIIVKVNNEIITSYDLKQTILTTLVLANQEINQDVVNQSKSAAVKSLVNSILKKNEAKRYNITLNKNELKNQLLKISEGDIIKFKKKFEINNLNFSLYEEKLKTELLWRKIIFNIYQEKVKINENEIQNDLLLLKDGKKKEEYRISEILLNFDSEKEKIDLINNINDQINKIGFENTALRFSESTSSIDNGDLGWVNTDGLTKKISDVLIKMNIKDISKPILLGNSIIFIKLTDKKSSTISADEIEDLKKKITISKRNELFNLYSASHLSKLKNNSIIQYK